MQSSVLTIIHCMAHYVDLQATTQTINSGTFQYYTTTQLLEKLGYIVILERLVCLSIDPALSTVVPHNQWGQCVFFFWRLYPSSSPATTTVFGSSQP